MIGPFERLLAEGFIYRRAAEQPRRLITVIGIWVLFGVPGLTCLLFAAMSDVPEMAGTAVLGIMPIISLAMIWKTTRNYINRKKHFMFEEEA